MSAESHSGFVSLMRKANVALANRDSALALAILADAAKLNPKNADIEFNRSVAHKFLGDQASALAALDAALAIEPYHLPSILNKGMLLEDAGRVTEAAAIYRNAITISPTADRLPTSLAEAHARARAYLGSHSKRLNGFFKDRLHSVRAKYPPSELKRFDESVEIYSGVTRAFTPTPSMFHFPALPPVAFFDRRHFPWFERLEAESAAISAELEKILDSPAADLFSPYVAYPQGAPVNQWGELNHSTRWASYFFWNNGARQADACLRAPVTAALLDTLPLITIPNFAPTAMFSALAPRTRIPPHTGSTNIRAIVHLPLILPGAAWFRVGNERRNWSSGEAWAFDDTIEHEAMNEAGETRVILIFDVWNPFLSEPERELVGQLLQAKDTFRTQTGGARETFE